MKIQTKLYNMEFPLPVKQVEIQLLSTIKGEQSHLFWNLYCSVTDQKEQNWTP